MHNQIQQLAFLELIFLFFLFDKIRSPNLDYFYGEMVCQALTDIIFIVTGSSYQSACLF